MRKRSGQVPVHIIALEGQEYKPARVEERFKIRTGCVIDVLRSAVDLPRAKDAAVAPLIMMLQSGKAQTIYQSW